MRAGKTEAGRAALGRNGLSRAETSLADLSRLCGDADKPPATQETTETGDRRAQRQCGVGDKEAAVTPDPAEMVSTR